MIAIAMGLSGTSHAASFRGIGDLGGELSFTAGLGVSADGSTVVGYAGRAETQEAFRWTESGGIELLGFLPNGGISSIAAGVSGDGSMIVGAGTEVTYSDPTTTFYTSQAFRWTSAGGMLALGSPPPWSEAKGVSADGSTVVGQGASVGPSEAFRWTSGGGFVGLGDLPGGVYASQANSTSADGSVVVGYSNGAAGNEAFRWTSANGMVGLGDLPGGTVNSFALGVSLDGSTVVGFGRNDLGEEAFLWTSSEGMIGLGALEGGQSGSSAAAVSGDGSTVVGSSIGSTNEAEAFIWDRAGGMRSLASVLTSLYGIDLTGWSLHTANSISADGTTIVGSGIGPSGKFEAWIAVIPEPSTAVLLGLGLAALARVRRRI